MLLNYEVSVLNSIGQKDEKGTNSSGCAKNQVSIVLVDWIIY